MSVKVIFKKYSMLDGSSKKLIQQVGDGSIIKRFDKTEIPKKSTDVVCPHFLELKWSYGCPYNCAWCYLKGTLRRLPTKTKPVIKDYNKTRNHLESFFEKAINQEILNSGEIADSLMWENNNKPFSKFVINLFEENGKTNMLHKVLFLSKSDNIKNLLSLKHNGTPVISFTLNAFPVSKQWEVGSPDPKKRIKAAKKLVENNYEVRIRIDPMVPINNWQIHYRELLDEVFSNFEPERVTIGSLRGLQSTLANCKDKSWTVFLTEKSGWGKKIDFDLRYEMYATMLNYLREDFNFKDVGFCKETREMWDKLGLNFNRIKCNCIW
jgi:spore photoproduct lyase